MALNATGCVMRDLREERRLTTDDLAALLSWSDRSLVVRYEKGANPLSIETLEWIAGKLDFSPEEVRFRLFLQELRLRGESWEVPSPVDLTADELRGLFNTGLAAGWAVADALIKGLVRGRRQEKAARALAAAAETCAHLLAVPPERRRVLVETFPEFRRWAVAVRLCEASVRAAAHRAEEALDLAELACRVAERIEEAPGWRPRLEGYCLAYRGNAMRVSNDFDGADEIFTRAGERWRAGEDADPPLLEEWKLLSLEASLRRAQHRFEEALSILDRAVAACGGSDEATARLLLKKEHVCEQMGDRTGALAALVEAAPLVERSEDPRLWFIHLHKLGLSLWHLGQFTEAAKLLPRLRELAAGLANELDLERVLWLESRVYAGLGEKGRAISGLEQVARYFTEQRLPYDAALSSLDLAILWLEEGRHADVRELALSLSWIFKAQKIRREALAALRLFCAAAQREVATVDLARRAITEIEKDRRSVPRSGKAARDRA